MITFSPKQSFFLFCAYLVTSIPFGVLLSVLIKGKDVRDQGSGNIGAANVSRLMGKKWGVVVLIFDALKGFVAVKLAGHYGQTNFENFVAVMAVAAHCWPLYLGFRGGKGVATALGVIFALSPFIVLVAVVVFLIVLIILRRISAASLSAALSVPFVAFLYPSSLSVLSAFAIMAIVWWKHRENLVRLWRNEEPRFL
jgi:glycerol-3-phosphate acyltransferase PlsY